MSELPLTIGTAGHVDHGKTALVAALTGVDTDRLPQEKARGLTIELGYAPLRLPSGRQLSLVDVPGHERFVRTMVAGAAGVDLFLMVVAADDGVMPQTREHAEVLRALGLARGVVAVSKCDAADPARACAEVGELLPGLPRVCCSARTGQGLTELRAAIERVADGLPSRARSDAPARLHVDRVFTVVGRGTVVTGTLWSGAVARGDELELLPAGSRVRVRGVQVHGEERARASAGQRVAVNLVGVKARDLARGDALGEPGALAATSVLDGALELRGVRHGERVQVHHGTRAVPGRLAALGDELWQLRLERPLLALDGDRVVVRRLAPPDTVGGGVVLDARARRHGRRPDALERLRRLRGGERPAPARRPPAARRSVPVSAVADRRVDEHELLAVELRLREAGTALLSEAQLAGHGEALAELRARGRARRVSGRLYAHADVLAATVGQVVTLIEREGAVTLAGARDALGLSRKSTQAFLEYLDAARVTKRLADDSRVLGRRA
jgi:selenocysteine-specific elongation factor